MCLCAGLFKSEDEIMTKTTQELEKELYDLLDRKSAINNKIIEANDKIKNLKSELSNLLDGDGSKGLISIKKQEIEDSRFPVYEFRKEWTGDIAYRIVNVTDKLICIKRDGAYNPERYKKDTGWRFKWQSEHGAIDAKKALRIWREWNEEN